MATTGGRGKRSSPAVAGGLPQVENSPQFGRHTCLRWTSRILPREAVEMGNSGGYGCVAVGAAAVVLFSFCGAENHLVFAGALGLGGFIDPAPEGATTVVDGGDRWRPQRCSRCRRSRRDRRYNEPADVPGVPGVIEGWQRRRRRSSDGFKLADVAGLR